jgi:hypothetical protein
MKIYINSLFLSLSIILVDVSERKPHEKQQREAVEEEKATLNYRTFFSCSLLRYFPPTTVSIRINKQTSSTTSHGGRLYRRAPPRKKLKGKRNFSCGSWEMRWSFIVVLTTQKRAPFAGN